MEKIITVAICTYKRYELLRQLLASFSKQTLSQESFNLLIVDNNDSEEERLGFINSIKLPKNAKVIYSEPPGLSRARNFAIQSCETKYIAFIDDDAIPVEDWLESLLDGFRHEKVAAVGGNIEPIWSHGKPDWIPEKYKGCLSILNYGIEDRYLSEHEYIYGTNMAFDVEKLGDIRAFKIELGRVGEKSLMSNEELELQISLRKLGWKIYFSHGATVNHQVHLERISQKYFISRMAWQAVSSLSHDSPYINNENIIYEVSQTSKALGLSGFVSSLLKQKNSKDMSIELDFLYNFTLLLLSLHKIHEDLLENLIED